MIHYDTKHAKRGSTKVKRIIWMVSFLISSSSDFDSAFVFISA